MFIICNNEVCGCGNGTVNEFVVVSVLLDKIPAIINICFDDVF